MELRVGTSGFGYDEWRGSFYPEDLPSDRRLAHYAGRLPAVEINHTFYRLPRQETLESWADDVPDGFRFAVKASRKITHFGRLRGVEEATDYLVRTVAAGLRDRAGPILFQLPPNFAADPERLAAFLDGLPRGVAAAFEFRHPSWHDDEVLGILREAGAALCTADTDEDEEPPALVSTAPWGYLRLRRSDYGEADLRAWVERIRARNWREAYVFFKHEEEAAGPAWAARLLELAGG